MKLVIYSTSHLNSVEIHKLIRLSFIHGDLFNYSFRKCYKWEYNTIIFDKSSYLSIHGTTTESDLIHGSGLNQLNQ